MSINGTISRVKQDQLWERIAKSLIPIYDAHYVCATAATELSDLLDIDILVILHSPNTPHFDLWSKRIGQKRELRQLKDNDSALMTIVNSTGPAEISVAQDSQLADIGAVTIRAAAFQQGTHADNSVPVGYVCLVNPGPQPVLDDEQLTTIALLIGSFHERAYSRYRAAQQEIITAVSRDISNDLTSTLSLQDILDTVANPMRSILNVETVSIGLINPVSGNISFVQELMGPLFDGLPAIELRAGEGIAGYVAETGETIVVNDVSNDSRFFKMSDQMSGFQTTSVACVPLQVENVVIGVLEAINKKHGDFIENDIMLLNNIAGPLAIALENARLHAQILSEKRRIETLFANMSEGLLAANADGRITMVNDALLGLLQTSADLLIGHQLSATIKLKSSAISDFVQKIQSAELYTPSIASDIQMIGAESFAPVLISGAPVRDETGTLNEMVFVLSDLAPMREFERMRDDLFENIIHEVRTPPAAILMYARMLLDDTTVDRSPKEQRFLQTIIQQSDQLQTMVRDMLTVAQLGSQGIQRSRKPTDLNALFEKLLPPFEDAATNKGLSLIANVTPDLPTIVGDRDVLHSIYKNLVDNAIKYTLEGTVRVTVSLSDDEIITQIADDGIGIPQEGIKNLFKRFYRASTAKEKGIAGTGLGLILVKDGIEAHGGSVSVESEVDHGTTFTVRLPINTS